MSQTSPSRQGQTGTRPTGTERQLTESQVHNLLRNERRRAVLRLITQSPEAAVAVRDLAEQIAAEETGATPPPRDTRQSVYISLIQTHLPALDSANVIEYDDQAKKVASTDLVDQLAPYTVALTRADSDSTEEGPADSPRSRRESVLVPALAVVATSWLLSAGASAGLPLLDVASPVLWSLCGVIGLTALFAYDRL